MVTGLQHVVVGSTVLALMLGGPGGTGPTRAAADTAAETAAGDKPAAVLVVELELSGVATDEFADLPEVAPAPTEGLSALRAPATAAGGLPNVLTAELETAPFSVVGLTWDASPDLTDVVIRYRVHQAGAWTEWAAVGASDIAPDADRAEGAEPATRGATNPIVAVDADGIQVWADAATGTVAGPKALLIDPGEDPAAAAGTLATAPTAAAAGPTLAALGSTQPAIISRAGWGADESWRKGEPDYSASMVSAAVHHTASTNSYTADQVPGLLRGFYAFHTRAESAGGRGWCDIGYNFLVDRFGRIFEGRAGGVDRSIVGVHTGGFNSRTIGVLAIGDFSSAATPPAMIEGLSRIIAWKFTVHRIFAGVNIAMVSGGGASKYPEGTIVQFPTIYAHRDAQQTSCPGQVLYNNLPVIRARVAELANATVSASPWGNWESTRVAGWTITVAGWMHDPDSTEPIGMTLDVNGVRTPFMADGARPDVDAAVPTAGARAGFSASVTTDSDRNIVRLLSLDPPVRSGCRAGRDARMPL